MTPITRALRYKLLFKGECPALPTYPLSYPALLSSSLKKNSFTSHKQLPFPPSPCLLFHHSPRFNSSATPACSFLSTPCSVSLIPELLDRIPQGSKARDQVESALSAADRIAIECDKRQVFDLDDLRRKSRTEAVLTEGKSAKRRRPKSVGLAVVQPGNKSWLG